MNIIKKGTKICILASILLSTTIIPLPYLDDVSAADTSATTSAIDDATDELKQLQKKEEKYRDIIELKQKEQEIITAQINKIANENTKIEGSIKENEQEISKLTTDIERFKAEIEQKENHIALQKIMLEKIIREKYQYYSKDSMHFTALNIANTNQSLHKDSLDHASDQISDYVKKIHDEQEDMRDDQTNLEKKSQRISDAKYELEQRSNNLESSQNYKRVLAAEVSVEEDTYQTKLSKVLEEQLAMQQEISDLSTGQIGNFSLADLPDKGEAGFDLPVNEPFVKTQGYGKTSFSSHYKGGMHNGVDYVASGNQNIIAVADGKIKATGKMGKYGYGNWVAIDHGNGLITLYGHMSSVNVSRGEKIDQGDKIGVMGNTGFSTGKHLHFTVFAGSTFEVVESSSVKNVFIPTGATVNPGMYL